MKSKIWRSRALGLAAAGLLCSSGVSIASVTMTFSESGSDVVLVASGTLNLSELLFDNDTGSVHAAAWGDGAAAAVGLPEYVFVDTYRGISGPVYFGSPIGSALLLASGGDGDRFGVEGSAEWLFVPNGYLSGSPLEGTSIFPNNTFASMGLTPGSYIYNWGSGSNTDSLTVQIVSVPEPSAALVSVLSFGMLMGLRRRKA